MEIFEMALKSLLKYPNTVFPNHTLTSSFYSVLPLCTPLKPAWYLTHRQATSSIQSISRKTPFGDRQCSASWRSSHLEHGQRGCPYVNEVGIRDKEKVTSLRRCGRPLLFSDSSSDFAHLPRINREMCVCFVDNRG